MQEDQTEKNLYVESEEDEYLILCVVDTSGRKFNLYSNLGTEKVVVCENMDEFMGVLTFVREMLNDTTELVYADPLQENQLLIPKKSAKKPSGFFTPITFWHGNFK